MNIETDYLNALVKCPKCNQLVRDGDRIWLNGECLCPKCYSKKREELDKNIRLEKQLDEIVYQVEETITQLMEVCGKYTNVKCIENILDYDLRELCNIKEYVKICPKCKSLFVAPYKYKIRQIYCGKECMKSATSAGIKQLKKQDSRYRKIDALRKLIYEREYRARIDNKVLPKKQLDTYSRILNDLKELSKIRNEIDLQEYNTQLNNLRSEYRQYNKIQQSSHKRIKCK